MWATSKQSRGGGARDQRREGGSRRGEEVHRGGARCFARLAGVVGRLQGGLRVSLEVLKHSVDMLLLESSLRGDVPARATCRSKLAPLLLAVAPVLLAVASHRCCPLPLPRRCGVAASLLPATPACCRGRSEKHDGQDRRRGEPEIYVVKLLVGRDNPLDGQGLKVHEDHYGQLGHRLCGVGRAYRTGFEACFVRCYAVAHRMGIDELRAAAGLFAHLLAMDVVLWHGVLGGVRITEEDTTSSSRILMKVMFQEMAKQLGVRVLGRRMNDDDNPVVRDALFPRDKAENTRFAINFFMAIGLGGVTEPARKILSL
ncbi:hypothetical protein ZWY2020_019688 [Hordeum vulgare]|nr:hypothetical protein ZWY2020_019688 [Hordeum vulgare]